MVPGFAAGGKGFAARLYFPAMTAPAPPTTPCRSCGAPASGPYCPECGAATSGRPCAACGAALSPGARFCHRCGEPDRPGVPRQTERTVWLGVAAVSVVTIVLTVVKMWGGQLGAPPAPEMGNAGNAPAGGVVRAPDLSAMTPREQFDRLFERVVGAAERQQVDTVLFFAPMAINAYALLPEVDADARYHAAMIHLAVGELAPARALADTILAEQPGHLFGILIQGEVAEAAGDQAALGAAYRAFRDAWERESAAARPEYAEHRPVLEDFRSRAAARR